MYSAGSADGTLAWPVIQAIIARLARLAAQDTATPRRDS